MRLFLITAGFSLLFFTSCDNSKHSDIDSTLPEVTNTSAPLNLNDLNTDSNLVLEGNETQTPQNVQ
ncbi:MAG: hypothetical protein ABIN48_10355, partial [Ginsengibacter sp.]